MPRKGGHSEEQVVFSFKQVENGAKVPEVCRMLGVSGQTLSVETALRGLGSLGAP